MIFGATPPLNDLISTLQSSLTTASEEMVCREAEAMGLDE